MDNKDARGSGEFKLEKPKENVRVVIRNNEDKILVLFKNNKSKSASGMGELPGGNLDPGESPLEAIVRETPEETKLDIKAEDFYLMGSFSYPLPVTEDGIIPQRIVIQYEARIPTDGSEIKVGENENDNHDRGEWLTEEQIRRLIEDKKLLKNSLHFDGNFPDK